MWTMNIYDSNAAHCQYLMFNCEQTHGKSETNNEFIIQIAIYCYPNIL